MNEDTTEIRLCWPNPDGVCLQGGCGYCSGGLEKDHIWKTPWQWFRYAEKKGLTKDFYYGFETEWPNREKREKKQGIPPS